MKGAVTTIVLVLVGLAIVGALSYNTLQGYQAPTLNHPSRTTGRVVATASDNPNYDPNAGSCQGKCNAQVTNAAGKYCYCDGASVTTYGDSCSDLQTTCPDVYASATGSSAAGSGSTKGPGLSAPISGSGGKCPGTASNTPGSNCNPNAGSCQNQCNAKVTNSAGEYCWCDSDKLGDSCSDWKSICSGSSSSGSSSGSTGGSGDLNVPLTNPGFEEYQPPSFFSSGQIVGWNSYGSEDVIWVTGSNLFSGSQTHSGNGAVKIVPAKGYNILFQKIVLEPNTNYALKGWIKTLNVQGSPGFGGATLFYALCNPRPVPIPFPGAPDEIVYGVDIEHPKTTFTGTNDWTEQQVTFNSGGQCKKAAVGVIFYGSSGAALFDDLSLQKLNEK